MTSIPSNFVVLKAALRRIGATACVLLAAIANAQDSQFYFDPNGNLFVQTGAAAAPPQIIGQPQNRIITPGDSASFFVVARDTRSLAYQWRFNGVPIGGATNDAVLLPNVITNNEGEYRVVLTNPSGSVTSAPALLIIDSDADGIADSWEFTHFGSLINSATVDADGDGSSNLQEYLDGTNPADTNSVLRHITLVRDGGSVIANPELPGYTNGQTVTLTATAFPGEEPFHAWLGDVVTRSNSITLVMTNNKTLHARFSPIIFTWTNLASGDWNVAANWSPNLGVGSNDSVVIPNNAIITLNTSADCADVTLGSASAIPTLTGSGTLRVRGSLAWLSGTMSGSGRTVIETGATMVVVSSSGVTLHTRQLENGGTVLWTGSGNFNLVFNAAITNRAGALFQVQNAANLGGGIDFGRLDNAGTFRKSGSTGATTFSSGMSLNNSGTVDIETGTLNLSFGGAQNGSFKVPAGTALTLSGGTFNATASSSITGAGRFTVNGGTANLAGLVNVSGTNSFSGSTANLTGNYICTNNTLNISGIANFSGNGLVSPSVVNFTSGTFSGTSTVNVNTLMNWTAGTMSGSGRTIIATDATLNVANPSTVTLNTRTLENGGTVLWTGTGNLGLFAGAVITNRASALFQVQTPASFTLGGNESGRVDNAGTFRKSVQAGTTTLGAISFNNSGTVDLQNGGLSLSGGGVHGGSFSVSAGSALIFSGGTHTANSSSGIIGAGQLSVSGGTANLAGLVNVSGINTFSGGGANLTGNYICTNNTLIISGATANFNGTGLVSPSVVSLSSGALGGNNPVTVLNAMTWTGGVMNGNGRTIISPSATLNIINPGTVQLNPRTLENGGAVLWTGAGNIALFGGSVITNRVGGLFHVQNAASFAWPGGGDNGRFDNAGTFRKSAHSGTTTLGSGSVVAFNNSGTVDIRSGILLANGSYNSSAGAVLNSAFSGAGAGTGFGQLQVAGAVTLNGALGVELINGFVPATNASFNVVTAGTRNGTFDNFAYPSNAVTMQLSNTANSVVVRATEVFVVPQPAPVPAGLISWWRAEGNALDHTGTNHGVLTNGASFAAGKVGQTFAFDGVDDYFEIPDSASLRPASVTIEAWVKFFATNGIRIVLGKPLGAGTFDSYGLALQDGAVLAAICDNAGFGPFLTGPANTVTGQWHHLAYTFDDGSKQQVLYVNGVPVASGTANKTMSYDTHPVLIGADMENGVLNYFHHGQIDEASLYNRALRGDEIVTIYNAGAAGKQLVSAIPQPIFLAPELIGSNIKLTWTAVSNLTYRLEFNPGLAFSNWIALPDDVLGVSNTASKLDLLTTSNRLYRVRVLP